MSPVSSNATLISCCHPWSSLLLLLFHNSATAVSKSPAHASPPSLRNKPPAVLSVGRVLPGIPKLLNVRQVNKLKKVIYKNGSYVGADITLLCKLYTTWPDSSPVTAESSPEPPGTLVRYKRHWAENGQAASVSIPALFGKTPYFHSIRRNTGGCKHQTIWFCLWPVVLMKIYKNQK